MNLFFKKGKKKKISFMVCSSFNCVKSLNILPFQEQLVKSRQPLAALFQRTINPTPYKEIHL